MDKSNIRNTKIGINFQEFEQLFHELEEILRDESFSQQDCYKDWSLAFKQIYGKENTNIRLYTIFSQIFYTAHLFILQFLLNDREKIIAEKSELTQVKMIQKSFLNEFSTEISFLNSYFLPLIESLERKNILFLDKLGKGTFKNLFKANIKPEYLFDYLIQQILKPLLRHFSGEFYTPPFLVKRMVKEAYKFGEKVLDPSCGTGNFLIEVIKSILSAERSEREKIRALNNIYGFDINPMSIFLTILNLTLLVGKQVKSMNTHFIITDSLFHEIDLESNKFDLIIGNPPWYTFRDIDSVNYQNKIKKLAEELEIKPSPKNVLNIEMSTLFFYKAKKSFMKVNAKIFFVITKGVITGSHASRFRSFKGFKDIKIWLFDRKIETIFNIDFICLYACKNDTPKSQTDYQIPSICFGLESSIEQLEYFDNPPLIPIKEQILIPYSVESKGNNIYVHKLIPTTDYQQLIPIEPSIYKKRFHKGADLNPRSLIFITSQSKNESLALVNPDERIFKRAKSPWNEKIFHNSVIEKKYIFKVLKSTELVKFNIFDFYHVFLPISKKNHEFTYSNLKSNARAFYDKINEYYLKNKKTTTNHTSLMDNLNRWSKLINERQFCEIKVVYNNSGSTLSSAVVQGDFLITGDLSFHATEFLDEAYYLSAILNSNLLNEQIKIKKSSRHIFKIPFENPIQKYDADNKSHQKLAQLGLQGEKVTITVIKEQFVNKNIPISRIKLQKILAVKLKPILTQIDELLKPQFLVSK